MARLVGIDSKEPAKVCGECGGWPATIRPNHKRALCETCIKHRE